MGDYANCGVFKIDFQFIKRYICHADGCGMKFQTPFLLQKHQRNVHGMQVTTSGNQGNNNTVSNNSPSQSGGGNNNQQQQQQQQQSSNIQQSSNNQSSNQHTTQNNQNVQQSQNQQQQPVRTGQPADDEPNMVECDMCGKMVRETSLAAHKKRHELAEKRPFKCEICGKVTNLNIINNLNFPNPNQLKL